MITLKTSNFLSSDTCIDYMTDSIYVYANPDVAFSTDTACFGEETIFKNLTINSIDADSMFYFWEFYDTIGGLPVIETSNLYEPVYEF